MKRLIDPSAILLRPPPEKLEDLSAALNGSWVACYNNLSNIDLKMSNFLCCVVEGTEFTKRELYTNNSEFVVRVLRPLIFTGINDLASQTDLLDRGLQIHLNTISNDGVQEENQVRRCSDSELEGGFLRDRPSILDRLYNAMARGLRDYADVELATSPRMLEYARFACAALPELGVSREEFMASLKANNQLALDLGQEASPVLSAIIAAVSRRPYEGVPADEFIKALKEHVSEETYSSKFFPKTARSLSGVLKRGTKELNSAGVFSKHGRADNNTRRVVSLWRKDGQYTATTGPSTRPGPEHRTVDREVF